MSINVGYKKLGQLNLSTVDGQAIFEIKTLGHITYICFVVVVVVVSYPLGGTRQGFEGLAPVVLDVLLPGPPLTVGVLVVVVGVGGPDDDRHPEKMNAIR